MGGAEPKTTLAFTWMLLTVDPNQALPHLKRLQAMFSDPRIEIDPALRAQWLALQASLLIAEGRTVEGIELAQQALAIAPRKRPLRP